MNHIRPPGWFPAVIVAILLHAAIAVAMLIQVPTQGTALPGMSGMQVGLAASGGATGEVAAAPAVAKPVDATSPDPQPVVTAREPLEQTTLIPTGTVEPVTEEVAMTVSAGPIDPVPEPAPPTEIAARIVAEAVEPADPIPEPVTETVAAVAPPPPPPLPVPRPKPEMGQTAEPQTATTVNRTTPAPAPTPSPEPEPAIGAGRTSGPGEAVQRAAPVTGGGGRSGDRSGAGVSSQDGARSGGGSPGERQDYLTRLLNWLERHKEYPRRAQRRRQEGTAMLFFRMDRDGRVTEFRIEKGSGHALLDAEVEAMIQRAQPLPAMPDFMQQSQLELVVPVNFVLR